MSFNITEALDEIKWQANEQMRQNRAIHLILSKLYPEESTETQSVPEGGQSSTSSAQANPLNTLYETRDFSEVSGHGS